MLLYVQFMVRSYVMRVCIRVLPATDLFLHVWRTAFDGTPVVIIHIRVPQHILQVMHVSVQFHTQAIKYEWISNALHLIGPTTQIRTAQENSAT